VVSFGGLWLSAARHHNSDYQRSAFAPYFLDTSSPGAALRWAGQTVVRVGDYGNNGVGLPLALFGALGLAALWVRRRALAVLLLGPLALATFASALKAYPFGDRLCFFAVPCLWLLAAAGIGTLAGRLRPGRLAWGGLALLALVLVPGTLRTA